MENLTVKNILLNVIIVFLLLLTGYQIGELKSGAEVISSEVKKNSNSPSQNLSLEEKISHTLTSKPMTYMRNGSEQELSLQRNQDIKHPGSRYSDPVFSIDRIEQGISIDFDVVTEEEIIDITDTEKELPSTLGDIYPRKPVLVSNNSQQFVLSAPTSTPSTVSWISRVDGENVLFKMSFSGQRFGKNILLNDGLTEIVDAYRGAGVLDDVLELYPSDTNKLNQFQDNMLVRRSANDGYNYRKVALSETNQQGDVLEVAIYSDSNRDGNISNCNKFTDPEYFSYSVFSGKCVMTIKTADSEIIITDSELSKLGGLPSGWLNNEEILVQNSYCDGMGCDNRVTSGTYNVRTQQNNLVLEHYSPCPWTGLSITFKNQGYILAVPKYNTGTSTLYKIASARRFEDFFVTTEGFDNICGPVKGLDTRLIGELDKITDIPYNLFWELRPVIEKPDSSNNVRLLFTGKDDVTYRLE